MADPRVVIVGAGFAGLQCARCLVGKPAEVVLVDRNNYHLFTPLLYQVASSLLNPSDIAQPVRTVLRKAANVRFLLGDVVGVDFEVQRIFLSGGGELAYDSLVLAPGSDTQYFEVAGATEVCHGLNDLPEAMELRNHVLHCFESATRAIGEEERHAWLTFVVVGGGPTGVEYAGALAELIRLTAAQDYGAAPREVRVILVEGRDRVLPAFRRPLSEDAGRRLQRRFGVELRLGALVEEVSTGSVRLSTGEMIRSRTVVWAAGVRPARLARELDLPRTDSGRIQVDEFLQVPGRSGVYAIGDAAGVTDPGGEIPMLAAPAIQEGGYVARAILSEAAGRRRVPFAYRDKGIMATIGRNSAVAQLGRLALKGFLGWVAWLAVHLTYIILFRNRFWVLLSWAWNYVLRDRPIRLILRAAGERTDT